MFGKKLHPGSTRRAPKVPDALPADEAARIAFDRDKSSHAITCRGRASNDSH